MVASQLRTQHAISRRNVTVARDKRRCARTQTYYVFRLNMPITSVVKLVKSHCDVAAPRQLSAITLTQAAQQNRPRATQQPASTCSTFDLRELL